MTETVETLDFALLNAIRGALHCGAGDAVMAWVSLLGGGILWGAVGLLLLFSQKHRLGGAAVLTALAVSLLLTELLIKPLFLRERPYLSNPAVALAVNEPLGSSFPSSHTASSFACAIPLFREKRLWGILGCAFAALVGFSRLYLYVHFPSDVLVGAVLGIGIGFLVSRLWERAGRKPPKKERSGGTP